MKETNVAMKNKYELFGEVPHCVTKLDGLVLIELERITKTRVVYFSDKLPEWAKYKLRTWGEAGVLKVITKVTPKIYNHGVSFIFFGYSNMHALDMYRMWNPKTNRIFTSLHVM